VREIKALRREQPIPAMILLPFQDAVVGALAAKLDGC
jgi:hypothetical protein